MTHNLSLPITSSNIPKMGEPVTTSKKPQCIAIIGTGPLSLLKAHFISLKNPNAEIHLFDSANQIGGAWYSDFSPMGHEIECGCHIWSYAPKAYHYIENELKVPLFPMLPPPVFIGKAIRLPYSLKNTIDTYKQSLKLLLQFKFADFKNWKKRPGTHFKIFGKKNKYPKLGSPELIHAISKLISKNDQIKLHLNTRVEKITINDVVTLHTNNKIFNAEQLITTYVSDLKEIILNEKLISVTQRKVDYIHFLLKSDQPLKKHISYWRYINDAIVHRITDISSQTGNKENLFLVGIKDKAYHSNNKGDLIAHVIKLMKKDQLIHVDQNLELVKEHIFPTYYMNEEAIIELKNNPKVSSLHTTDLMYGLHYLLTEEMPHFMQTPK